MDRYDELQNLVRSFEKDFKKFYKKGNKEAGIRLRKQMQALRAFAKNVRNEVQNLKQAQDQTTTD
jgi:hypothetical protein